MLFPYLGEKSKLANFITKEIPQNISHYVEPFGGSFGIFFALDFTKYKDVKFIYNDVNYLNYNLFNQLRDNQQFIHFVKPIKVDINRYKLALKEILTEKNDVKLAINWLIILTCSSPYEIGKESWRGSSEFDIFKMKYKAYKFHVDKITEIDKLDYKEIINKYDSESTFFYVDPPYMGKESYYINHDFNSNTHIELANILNNIKGKFLLSYYNFNGLQELYKNCKIESKVTPMGTELIILNY